MKLPWCIARCASPREFYALTGCWPARFGVLCALLMAAGLYGGLVLAGPDALQGEVYRILYVHVPSAWMSLFVYVFLAASGVAGLVWRVRVFLAAARACAPLGAAFTLLTLLTGAIWGKPTWGAWWAWDARLTSELILLFLYLGFMALQAAIPDPRAAARAGAVLALVGLVNVPIIHFSVEWWSTLHQGSSVSLFAGQRIHVSMLVPLLLMAGAFKCYFIALVLVRTRAELLILDRDRHWVAALADVRRVGART